MRHLHTGPIVAAILLAAIVAGFCSYADARLSRPPDPTPPVVITVLPASTPTPVTPEVLTRVPTAQPTDGVLWRATETPTPLVTATPVPSMTPTPTREATPTAAVQRGLAP